MRKNKSYSQFGLVVILSYCLVGGLSSCNSLLGGLAGNPRNPCQWPRKWFRLESRETCISRSYLGYKPVIKDGTFAWKLCSVKRDYNKLKQELFICVDNNNYEPLKGLPNNFQVDMLGQYQTSPGDNGATGSNLPFLNSVGEIKDGVKHYYSSVVNAFNACPYYSHIKDEAERQQCPSYNCLREETENKLDNCLHRENGGKAEGDFSEIPCPKDVSNNNHNLDLYDPANQRSRFLTDGIRVLYDHYDYVENNVDYVVDPAKDLLKSTNKKVLLAPRMAYIKLEIGPSGVGNKDHHHKLVFRDKTIVNAVGGAKDSDGISINLDQTNQSGLRYCSMDDYGKKTYVVSVPITSANNHIITIQDIDDSGKEVAKAELIVASLDKFSNQSYQAQSRALTINAIKLPITEDIYVKAPNSVSSQSESFRLPDMANGRLAANKYNTLEKALEDAFALDEKSVATSSIGTVHPSVDITVNSCTLNNDLKDYFLPNGDLILKVDDIWKSWNKIGQPLDYKLAYVSLLGDIGKELYKKHSSACSDGGYVNIEKQISPILVGGIQLGDRINQNISEEDEGKPLANSAYAQTGIDLAVIGSPKQYFVEEMLNGSKTTTLGISLPFEGSDANLNALEYCTTPYVFAKHLYKIGLVNSSTDFRSLASQVTSHATMTLAHEMCHSWAQTYFTNGSGTGTDIHDHYCAGYNYASCNFTQRVYTSGAFTSFDSNGIVFCEAHRHLFFNQLMRKYFKGN